jgi:putative ABC transport system permease protein
MAGTRAIFARLLTVFRRKQLEDDLEEELRFHLDMETSNNVRNGMELTDAQRAARIALGNPESIKEECRDARNFILVGSLMRDLRFAIRVLWQNPGFTTVALLSLALGIGANAMIFSVLDAVLLRPLPYEEPDRIVVIGETSRERPDARWPASVPNFIDWREQNNVFEEVSAVRFSWSAVLSGAAEAYRFEGHLVTEGYFKILGGTAAVGRVFLPEDYQEGGVLLLSYGFWQRHFGCDPNVVGKPVEVDDRPYRIVGVLSPRFRPLLFDDVEVWAPLAWSAARSEVPRDFRYLFVIGRLGEGVSGEQAQAEMDTIASHLAQAYPKTNEGMGARVDTLQEGVVGWAQSRLLVLFGAVCFVLLIACANVAILMLVRASTRQKEIAIRASLGAGRARIVRQLLTESALLAFLGGALGLLLASWGLDLLVAFSPGGIPRLDEVAIDSRIFAFTLLVALATGLLFGLAPALTVTKLDLNESLKEGGRPGATGMVRQRAHRVLAVSEVALALILLIGAGLMLTSFLRLYWVPLGFDPENVVTMQIHLPRGKYVTTVGKTAEGRNLKQLTPQAVFFREEAVRRLNLLPGVDVASISAYGPFSGCYGGEFSIEGQAPASDGSEPPWTCFHPVSPEYFEALRIPLHRGRIFDEKDTHDAPWAAVINETMARCYFAGQDPIGKGLTVTTEEVPEEQLREIVGVVGDTKQRLHYETIPEVYVPFPQQNVSFIGRYQPRRVETTFVVRGLSDPSSVVAGARRVVAELDQDLPIFGVETLEQSRTGQLQVTTFYMLLLAVFAGIALILSVMGVYGVVSYSVTRRTHEIGIRVALGAGRTDVRKLFIKEGLVLAIIGVTIGVASSIGLTGLISSQLYGVEATDPMTFVAVSLILLGVTLSACYIPARRASKVEPMMALRHE